VETADGSICSKPEKNQRSWLPMEEFQGDTHRDAQRTESKICASGRLDRHNVVGHGFAFSREDF